MSETVQLNCYKNIPLLIFSKSPYIYESNFLDLNGGNVIINLDKINKWTSQIILIFICVGSLALARLTFYFKASNFPIFFSGVLTSDKNLLHAN